LTEAFTDWSIGQPAASFSHSGTEDISPSNTPLRIHTSEIYDGFWSKPERELEIEAIILK
jgi:hypothetical protein